MERGDVHHDFFYLLDIEREKIMYKKRLKRHQVMINFYGCKSAHICGECKHLRYVLGKKSTYLICNQAGLSHGVANEWRKRWDACGKFELEK